MICATDQNEEFTTYWHVPPPPACTGFTVTSQEWVLDSRHIYSWRKPALPAPDEQGWVPVPAWWRETA